MLLVITPQTQRVARRELSAGVQMVLAPGTAASTRAPQGPRGEGLSHGWDETGGGQEPGVSSPQATTRLLWTSEL